MTAPVDMPLVSTLFILSLTEDLISYTVSKICRHTESTSINAATVHQVEPHCMQGGSAWRISLHAPWSHMSNVCFYQ